MASCNTTHSWLLLKHKCGWAISVSKCELVVNKIVVQSAFIIRETAAVKSTMAFAWSDGVEITGSGKRTGEHANFIR